MHAAANINVVSGATLAGIRQLTSRTDMSAAITMPIDTASPCRKVPYPVAVSMAWPNV
jgi:hypothetical protein